MVLMMGRDLVVIDWRHGCIRRYLLVVNMLRGNLMMNSA